MASSTDPDDEPTRRARARALAAAIELLHEVRPNELTPRRVAEAADLTEAEVAASFATPEELVALAVRAVLEHQLEHMRSTSPAPKVRPAPSDALAEQLADFMFGQRTSERVLMLGIYLDAGRNESTREGVLAGVAAVEALMEGWLASAGVRPSRTKARALVALLQGYAIQHSYDAAPDSAERRALVAMISLITSASDP